ncbi:MAG: DNA alkylation repair protein [Pseudomonadota bacterium]
MAEPNTPDAVLEDLRAATDAEKIAYVTRFYAGDSTWNRVMGVPMPKVFPIAKAHAGMDMEGIEALLDDPHYEARMTAVSIMDFQVAKASCPEEQRKALYELYLRRHDRIDTWDLVDRAAPKVIGRYLEDRDRSVLDDLALSDNPWERRTAIVATFAFLRLGEVSDTLRIAGLLAGDPHTYVQKAVGSWLREAGKRDESALVAFLTAYRDVLPKPTRKAATEKLSPALQAEFRG